MNKVCGKCLLMILLNDIKMRRKKVLHNYTNGCHGFVHLFSMPLKLLFLLVFGLVTERSSHIHVVLYCRPCFLEAVFYI